jgi:hypothetical protein
MKITAGILLLLAAAACSPSVPSEPTWVDDVRPILAANCIRCHSPPQIDGASISFRLDKYGNEEIGDTEYDPNKEPDLIGGAHDYATSIASQTADGNMPPRFKLTGRQIDVLAAWDRAGAPRGDPRPDNQRPAMTVSGDIRVADDRVAFDYEIDDADGDIVTGILKATPMGGGAPFPVSNELFVGRGFLKGVVPTGSYALSAKLDDGNDDEVEVDLGTVEVP